MDPDALETRLLVLEAAIDEVRRQMTAISTSCRAKHVELDADVATHDREIDLIRSELKEHGRVLEQVSKWVERWGMETTALGNHLEHLDERQALLGRTTDAVLEKLGAVMNVVNGIAADVRRGNGG